MFTKILAQLKTVNDLVLWRRFTGERDEAQTGNVLRHHADRYDHSY